jgi:hypothetical protein
MDESARLPPLRDRFEIPRLPCSSKILPCFRSQGIRRYDCVNVRESRPQLRQESLIGEDFPVFSLWIRELAAETSSLQTGSTAIQSAAAETSGAQRGFGRERPAESRALGTPLGRIRTGDCGFRDSKAPQSVFVSVAELGGSVSLPIRLSGRFRRGPKERHPVCRTADGVSVIDESLSGEPTA